MPTTYPRDIVDGVTGRWGRIHQGHGLDPELVKADLIESNVTTPTDSVDIEEVWYDYRPRVKWCDRIDFGCGLEGDWHEHWFGIQAGPPDAAYTCAFFARGGDE